ncbi:hypothetical protein BN59_02918 [Legionella massiliensis]|uniref:Yip1 domain protein n=1 Tax=Legionella massiliensis TaxID=1034943 RepID=A0A078L3U1_9GAMM|nr:hypothetical protein [Legionella massiliensis]CDZ78608.1 hypothetical protein BN59_02918 [Legionella massiliensis]CEE14346.1 hypothetical protein BN1094_02918 [Legionella massiliensis]
MWETLLKRYWMVALLKESPENTPYSPFLMVMVAFLFFILILFQWYLADLRQQFNLAISILAALTLLCSYFVYTFVILKIYRKAGRALQTLTSLLASHLIVHFFAFPLLLATPLLINSDLNQGILLFIGIVYLVLTLILTFWQFMVTIHIYKQALELDYLSAILASFGLLACNILTVSFWQ